MHQSIEYAQYKAQCIKELIPGYNRPGITILDFGCADGLMTYYLQEVFFQAKVIGIDESQETIKRAKQEYSDIAFEYIKNKILPFPGKYFDAIIAADTLHHISLSMHQYWLKELMHCLKPEGFFIMLEPNPWNITSWLAFNNNSEEQRAHMISPIQAKKLVKSFGVTKIYRFSLPWPFFLIENYVRKIPLGAFYCVMVKKN